MMTEQAHTETLFSPRRWFLGADGLLRPIWRSLLFVLLATALFFLVLGIVPKLSLKVRLLTFWGAMAAGLLIESWFLLSVIDRKSFRSLGLWFYSGWARELFIGVGVGLVLISTLVVILTASGALIYRGMNLSAQILESMLVLAGLFILGVLFEEAAFRGYGLQRMIDAVGSSGAVVLFSFLFTFVHLRNPSAGLLSTTNTFLAGVLLGTAYVKTRALWLPIGLHWAWNVFLGPVGSLPLSGYHWGPHWLQWELTGPEWLTGGSYGPEGSIVLTVAIVPAIIWLGRTRAISPSPAVEEGLE